MQCIITEKSFLLNGLKRHFHFTLFIYINLHVICFSSSLKLLDITFLQFSFKKSVRI